MCGCGDTSNGGIPPEKEGASWRGEAFFESCLRLGKGGEERGKGAMRCKLSQPTARKSDKKIRTKFFFRRKKTTIRKDSASHDSNLEEGRNFRFNKGKKKIKSPGKKDGRTSIRIGSTS